MQPPTLAVIIFPLILWATPAAAQAAPTDYEAAQLADDVRGIRQALDRLVALTEIGQQHRKIDLVLKRIELRERRLEPLQRRLASAEAEVDRKEEQLKVLARMLEQHEEALDAEIRDGRDDAHSETRRTIEDIKRSQIGATERLETAQLRVQLYENDLAIGQREIEILDGTLAELLEDADR